MLAKWTRPKSARKRKREYEAKYGSMEDLWPAERERRLARRKQEGAVRAIVDTFSKAVMHFVPESKNEHGRKHLSTREKILISIALVVIPINDVLQKLYEWGDVLPRYDGLGHGWTMPRMVRRGWCPLEAKTLLAKEHFYGQYFFSSFRSPRWGIDHRYCIETVCHGTFVETSFEMVREHRIPVISWNDDTGLQVAAYDLDAPRNYVAIFHVWSDGMGNEDSNSLPMCQLLYIQGLVETLYAEDHPDNKYVWAYQPESLDVLQYGKKKTKLLNLFTHLREVPIRDFRIEAPIKLKLATEESTRFDIITIPLSRRSTTRKSDETICLATLLDLDPQPLLRMITQKTEKTNGTWEEKQAEDQRVSDLRMAAFVRMVYGFSPDFIFSPYPRLPLRGFRWAPRTYISFISFPNDRGVRAKRGDLNQDGHELWRSTGQALRQKNPI
ncbi:hypothetical protein BJX99DRAFT_253216 [Aspergillus californicus]